MTRIENGTENRDRKGILRFSFPILDSRLKELWAFLTDFRRRKIRPHLQDKDLFRRIVGYFKPQWKRLVVDLCLTLAIAGAGSLLPIIVSRGVDLLKGVPASVDDAGCRRRGAAHRAVDVVLQLGTAALDGHHHCRSGGALAIDAYSASVEHDLSFYDEFSSGKIVSRITSDTRDFGELVSLITDVASQFVEA